MTYGETQGEGCPVGAKDRVIHAALKGRDLLLMASDTPDDDELIKGTNVQISLNCESLSQIESQFKALSDKGSVNQPLHDAFWGARFGMLTDRYGVHWMLSFDTKKQ